MWDWSCCTCVYAEFVALVDLGIDLDMRRAFNVNWFMMVSVCPGVTPCGLDDVALVEFMRLVFTRMPGKLPLATQVFVGVFS